MFKGLGQIASLMKQAQEMQGRFSEIQDELRHLKVEGTAGGGMVRVEMNGQQQMLSCTIDPALFASGDREMLEDLLTGAVNQALEHSREAASRHLSQLTNGLDLAGLQGMLSGLGLGRPS